MTPQARTIIDATACAFSQLHQLDRAIEELAHGDDGIDSDAHSDLTRHLTTARAALRDLYRTAAYIGAED